MLVPSDMRRAEKQNRFSVIGPRLALRRGFGAAAKCVQHSLAPFLCEELTQHLALRNAPQGQRFQGAGLDGPSCFMIAVVVSVVVRWRWCNSWVMR
jgi:hypothetical protein